MQYIVEYITHHILFQLLRDSSAALGQGQHNDQRRDGMGAIAILMRWFVGSWGAMAGGIVVHVTDYSVGKLEQFGGLWLVYAVATCIVVGGPDLGPPITLCNGVESLPLRLAFSGLAWLSGQYGFGWKDTERDLWMLSALWHMWEANGEFHKISRHSYVRLREDRASDDDLSLITKMLLLQFFRLGAGIGIFWAIFGVYSLTNFLWGMLIIAFLIFAPQIVFKLMGIRPN